MKKTFSLFWIMMASIASPDALSQAEVQPLSNSTIYVDRGISRSRCDNYNVGTRNCMGGSETAFREIVTAARRVSAGFTVLIQPGVYEGGVIVNTSGSESAPIIFRTTGPGVVIEGSANERDAFFITAADHIVVDGLTIQHAYRAAIRISQSNNVTIRNCIFADNGYSGLATDFSDYTTVENCESFGTTTQHGINIGNSSDYPIIRGNRIHHNRAAGLQINGDIGMGGDGIVSYALIENNVIYENGSRGGAAINLDGVTNSIVRNNLLYNNRANGISLYQTNGGSPSRDIQILNNTIVMSEDARWGLYFLNTSNNKVFNNIILNNNPTLGSIMVGLPISSGFESDHNIVMDQFETEGRRGKRLNLEEWQALGYDQNSLLTPTSELFIDVANNNFEPGDGSPAIDNGIQLDDVATDLYGKNRPAGNGYDIGAFEH